MIKPYSFAANERETNVPYWHGTRKPWKTYMKNAGEAGSAFPRIIPVALELDFCEDDHERKQHQRFDQSQTDNHHDLDTSGCSRVAGSAFDS